jgi:hypothetical protein
MKNSKCDNIGVYNFDCVIQNQGYTVEMVFNIEGEPLDLTIYPTIKLAIKSNLNSLITTLGLGSGLEIVGENNNILRVTFDKELTLILKSNIYYYDILFVTVDNKHQYFLKGEIKVNSTITR